MKKISLILIFIISFSISSCGDSTVYEPKSEFEEFTDKVWVYKHSNIGTFENISIQKMKFNQDSTCKIMINNNWESGKYSFFSSTQSNDIYGLTVIYFNDTINQHNSSFFNLFQFDSFNKDSLVIHFGSTKENSWHTYVPEM